MSDGRRADDEAFPVRPPGPRRHDRGGGHRVLRDRRLPPVAEQPAAPSPSALRAELIVLTRSRITNRSDHPRRSTWARSRPPSISGSGTIILTASDNSSNAMTQEARQPRRRLGLPLPSTGPPTRVAVEGGHRRLAVSAGGEQPDRRLDPGRRQQPEGTSSSCRRLDLRRRLERHGCLHDEQRAVQRLLAGRQPRRSAPGPGSCRPSVALGRRRPDDGRGHRGPHVRPRRHRRPAGEDTITSPM